MFEFAKEAGWVVIKAGTFSSPVTAPENNAAVGLRHYTGPAVVAARRELLRLDLVPM